MALSLRALRCVSRRAWSRSPSCSSRRLAASCLPCEGGPICIVCRCSDARTLDRDSRSRDLTHPLSGSYDTRTSWSHLCFGCAGSDCALAMVRAIWLCVVGLFCAVSAQRSFPSGAAGGQPSGVDAGNARGPGNAGPPNARGPPPGGPRPTSPPPGLDVSQGRQGPPAGPLRGPPSGGPASGEGARSAPPTTTAAPASAKGPVADDALTDAFGANAALNGALVEADGHC